MSIHVKTVGEMAIKWQILPLLFSVAYYNEHNNRQRETLKWSEGQVEQIIIMIESSVDSILELSPLGGDLYKFLAFLSYILNLMIDRKNYK